MNARTRWVPSLVLAAVAVMLTGCSDGDGTSVSADGGRDPSQRYKATATALESPDHGPQLCLGGVLTSLPPQCGGPDLVGWDWDDVPDKESARGTTWAEVTVVGTFDGSAFTVTERPRAAEQPPEQEPPDFSPVCSDPDGDPNVGSDSFQQEPAHPDLVATWFSAGGNIFNVLVRPGATDSVRAEIRTFYEGLLCIAERDQPSLASLRAVQDRVIEESKGSPLGGVSGVGSDGRRGVVVIQCSLADEVSKAWAVKQWGKNIELVGALTPVD